MWSFCSDPKPDNILVYVFGCTPGQKPNWERLSTSAMVIKIADFGCGRRVTAQDASMYVHTIAGTLQYMAPEVMSESYGVKADIWSFGVIMYELATKEMPQYGTGKYFLPTM